MNKIVTVLFFALTGLAGCAGKPVKSEDTRPVSPEKDVIVVLPNCQELAGQVVCQWIEPPQRLPIEEAAAQEPHPAPASI